MSAHLRMNAIYWGLTALCILDRKDALDRDELIKFVHSCWDNNAGTDGPFSLVRMKSQAVRQVPLELTQAMMLIFSPPSAQSRFSSPTTPSTRSTNPELPSVRASNWSVSILTIHRHPFPPAAIWGFCRRCLW